MGSHSWSLSTKTVWNIETTHRNGQDCQAITNTSCLMRSLMSAPSSRTPSSETRLGTRPKPWRRLPVPQVVGGFARPRLVTCHLADGDWRAPGDPLGPRHLFGRDDDIHVGGWRSCPAPGPPFGPLRLGARTRLPKSLATCHHGVGPASTEAFAARLLDMLGAKPVVA